MVDLPSLADPGRLQALARTELMDSGAEEVFDRLTRLVATVIGAPVAEMTLLDANHQFVKSRYGAGDHTPVALVHSYCRHVVGNAASLMVRDVREDDRIPDPSALLAAECIAYCGVPLTDGDGHTLGALCAIDRAPHDWSERDVSVLRDLAAAAMTEIELRLARRRLLENEREAGELRRRQARLAGVVHAAGEAINLVDLEGRVVGWNPACERLYGWSEAEVLGRPLTEIGMLDPGSDDQAGFAHDARGLAGESVAVQRLPRRRRDGARIYVDLSITPLRDEDGAIMGITAVARDVTDRHRLQGRMAQSERRFRHTFDAAPTGIVLVAPDRRLLDVNRAFCEMIGYAHAELVGRPLDHVTHPEDLGNGVEAAHEMVAGTRQGYETERRYRHRDGHIVRVRLTASLVRDDAGAPQYFIAHIEDVTEARGAQLALAEARELLEESQAAAHVGSWSFDLHSGAISWSREQFRLHGLDPDRDEPTMAALIDRVVPGERALVRATLDRLLAHPQPFAAEYRVNGPGGTVRALATSAEIVDAGRVFGLTRDVTAERAADAARQAAEQRQRRLLETLPDTMVVLYDLQMRCVLMQGGLLAEAGIDPDAYLGGRLTDQLVDESARVLPQLVTRALAGEAVSIDHETDAGRWFQIEIGPFHGPDGTITGAFTVWRDITARRAREHEHRMLALMVQQSQDAIIARDFDGRITEWSGGAERMYGWTREQALGRRVIELMVPLEQAAEEQAVFDRVIAGGTSQRDAIRRRRDGSTLHVSLSVSPLTDDAGQVTGVMVVARDVSDRIAEQAARREAEERLRVIVEHAPIGVGLLDLSGPRAGRLLSANRPFAELMPDTDPAGPGLPLTSVVHPDEVDRLRADLALLAADPAARTQSELRALHPGGRETWLYVTGAAVPSESGRPDLAVLHAMDIGDRKRFEGQLQHLADHDTLTGLYNRRRFESELERAVSLSDRYGYGGALLVLDLDGFKAVNDTLGHRHGDELLVQVARALRETLRETDIVGRLGGDEFAVILDSVDADTARSVAGKLLAAVVERGRIHAGTREASVSTSIGIAPIDRARGLDAEALTVEADLAMYAAKAAGAGRIAMAGRDAPEHPTLGATQSWLRRLRTALDEDRFELYAQPIRPICGPEAEQWELLLRMRDDAGELIAPATFLHNAERFDLVQEIDRWVFARALRLLDHAAAAGRSDVMLSVNMSGKTLSDRTLLDDLAELVREHPVPAGRLVVEVTETAAIVNIERARLVAEALRELGCRFALDDFGAGFASHYYLKHLDFDYVKIDGEFIAGLAAASTDRLVVRSMVELAHGLGARTIAEFIGDDATVQALRELGVDYGQGYHLGRPRPVAEVLPGAVRTPVG